MKLKFLTLLLLLPVLLFGQTTTVTVNTSTKVTQPPVGLLTLDGPTGFKITRGTGTPEGSVSATPGSLYLDQNGLLWVKNSGVAATGWGQLGLVSVTSVFGRTGAVTAQSGDYAAFYEPTLGNPSANGYVLSSTTGGTRSWISPSVADGNKGDITVSGGGASWVINPFAVTYGKMQAAGTFSKLIGSPAASTTLGEITLGTNLSMSGSTLNASGGGTGTVTNFSAGDLSPLFTTTEATTTTTPALSFTLSNAAANTVFGNNTASSAAPVFSSSPRFTAIGNLTSNGFVTTTGGIGTLGIDTTAYTPTTRTLTIAGTASDLSANRTWTQDNITGLASTGIIKRTGANTLAIATAGTDYLTGNQSITLTGDVTGTGATSIATTIATGAVTYGKMQAATAFSRLIGSPAAGTTLSEITLGTNLSMSGSTLNAAAGTGAWGGSETGVGNINYTILSTDRIVYTNAAFTAPRTWTLPAASAVPAGTAISVIDQFGTVTTTNTLTLSGGTIYPPNSGSYIMSSIFQGVTLVSDGTSKWYAVSMQPGGATAGNFAQQSWTTGVWASSPYTLPTSIGTSGKILQSNGTNAVFSASTWPTSGAGTGSSGTIIRSNGTNYVSTTAQYPDAAGTAGKVLVSDGTNFVSSTPTFPNASATSGKIIKSDGTNWVASTETYAAPGTSGNVLTSNGTNWISSAPAGGGGNVSNSGTPTANQIAQWTDATHIQGVTPTSPLTAGAGSLMLDVSVDHAFTNSQTITLTNASTASSDPVLGLQHNSSGTPLANFGTALQFYGKTSTTNNRPLGSVQANWSTPTEGSQTAYLDFLLTQSAASASKMRLHGSGGLSINNTTDPGAGVVSANTGFKIAGTEFPTAANGLVKRTAANTYAAAVAKTDYWDTTDFVASGASGAHGLVPTPGTTAGTTKFLREDATWAVPAGGSATPGGSDTYVQFNDASAFGGDADLTWDKTNNILTTTGTYRAGNGSATTPTYSFGSGTGSGMFLASSNLHFAQGTGDIFSIGTFNPLGLRTQSGYLYAWSSTGAPDGAVDTALGRNAAGVVEINNGTAGTYKDLKADKVNAVTGFQVNTAAPNNYELTGDGTKFAAKASDLPNGSSAQQTGFSSNTYLAGSVITLNAGDFKVGSTYRCMFDMAKTTAGSAAPVITIYIGTNGSTADTAVQTITWAAATGVADTGMFEVWVNFRAVGASATIASVGKCAHNLAATGLTSTGAAGVGVVSNSTSSTFNSTAATKIGCAFNGGASYVGTNNMVQAYYSNP